MSTLKDKKRKIARKLGEKGKERVVQLGIRAGVRSSRGRDVSKEDRALDHIYRNDPKGYAKAYKNVDRHFF